MAFSALLTVFWATEAQAAKGSFEQTLSVDGPVVLDVTTGSGSISVETGDSGTVTVIGHIKVGSAFAKRSAAEAEKLVEMFKASPPVELDNGRLLVGHVRDRAYRKNVSISYEIVVPANTEVVSDTGSGSQKISGITAPVKAKTGSGSVTLSDIGGPVTANTGSGRIKAERVAGSFEGHTGSGSINFVQIAPGDVEATAGSGSITLQGIVGSLRAKAGSGRINIQGTQTGDWRIKTGSGSVKIDLPDDATFLLDASSSSGGITVDYPVTVRGKISRKHLRGNVGDGDNELSIDTGSGGIKIH